MQKKDYRSTTIKTLPLTKIYSPLRQRRGVGSLTAQLDYNDKKIIDEIKLDALNDAVMLHPQKVNHIIRSLLSDKNDEIRLLAFQLLNKQENEILPKINAELTQLSKTQVPSEIFFHAKSVSLLYWELDYRGLIEKKLSDFTLKKSLHYALEAIKHNKSDLTLLLMIARIYLKIANYDEAEKYFEAYLQQGGFKERVVSYFVEIYYYQGHYDKIKKLVAKNAGIKTIYMNDDLIHLWNPSYVR